MNAERKRRRRIGGVLIGLVAVVAVAAVAVAAFGFNFRLSNNNKAQSGSNLPAATAKVTRETLVETWNEDGELGYGNSTILTSRAGGTVTKLSDAGTTVQRGAALYYVDAQPIVLLYGSLPAYRAMTTGVKGTDVKQLERNLKELGYTGFTVDNEFTASTATAVKKWQKKLGLKQTGSVELGRAVFADGPVRVNSVDAARGDAIGPGTPVLTFTGMSPVVTVAGDVEDKRLVREGGAVEITLPDEKKVSGKITNIQTVIKTGQDSGSETKLQVSISIDDKKAVEALDHATVQVSFVASKKENVLTVPVAALLALSEGGYGVEVVEGGKTHIVTVKTGLFAGGKVEVTGDDLEEGMTVGMPS
ncbi:MAG: efflux RND transporter periplasmic adaptor subunit [Micromonosporaceae bacterium]